MSDLKKKMQSFYNQSTFYRDVLSDLDRYRLDVEFEQYVSLVRELGPKRGIFLDLGCGTGETTRRLAARGSNVIGADISKLFLKTKMEHVNWNVPGFVVADISCLPFRDGYASCVAMNSVIEHIPNVDELFEEILRVLSDDGRVIIVSPNLISPLKPIRHIMGMGGLNTDFYGSKLKALGAIFSNLVLIVGKLLSRKPKFTYRTPLLDDFKCPDDDAVYMANVIDLKKWFASRGFTFSYRPLMGQNDSFLGRLKVKTLSWFPWLDKGFCVLVEQAEQTARNGNARR